jgi:hypothetical protein
MISARMVAGVSSKRLVPIIRAGTYQLGKNCAIPSHLAGLFAIDMRPRQAEANFPQVVETLYGTKEMVPIHIHVEATNGRAEVSRLANLEMDGWELLSGVVSRQRAPKTFWIPSERERRSLRKGDTAKLIFDICEKQGEEPCGERMWVVVIGREGPYFVGALNNYPISPSRKRNLDVGSRVLFLPEHVIEIHRQPISLARTKVIKSSGPSVVAVHSGCH